MENKEIKETIMGLCKEQIGLAKKYEIVSKATKENSATFAWKGKYDPWLLEPRHIAIELEVSLAHLERLILDSEDPELQEYWNDYKKFQLEVMMYDETFGQIRKELAEFALSKFDKNETTKTDAIVKLPTQELIDAKLKIKELEKLLEKK